MVAAFTIIVETATIVARAVSNSGMSNTNTTLVVFSAIVATVAAAVLRVRRGAVLMRAMSIEAVKE